MSGCKRSNGEWLYLLDVGLSLCSMTSLSLCISATLALILSRERSARGVVGSGHCQSYVVRRRRHHVRQSRKMNRRESGLDLRCLCEVVRSKRGRTRERERIERRLESRDWFRLRGGCGERVG